MEISQRNSFVQLIYANKDQIAYYKKDFYFTKGKRDFLKNCTLVQSRFCFFAGWEVER
jgi:hypothetical protein